MPRTLLKRLHLVLKKKFDDIIDYTIFKEHKLQIHYKDNLIDVLVTDPKDIKYKTKSPWKKQFCYLLDDDYKLFPFENIEFISYNKSMVPIINFKCEFLINQLINLHRTIYFFSNIELWKNFPNYIFHNKTINYPNSLRLAIIKILKNKIPQITINTIWNNFPNFNKDYNNILDQINKKSNIESLCDLTDNSTIQQWCENNNKEYGIGDLFFYDTLNWLKNNIFIHDSNNKDWLYIDKNKLKEIKSLPHCILITDSLVEELLDLINPKIHFDIKLKLNYVTNYQLTVMRW